MLSVTATELARLMHCIGSRNMSRAVPAEDDDEPRREGNAADWLAIEMFEGRDVQPGARAPNGWIVTDEMMEHVRQYVSALNCGAVQPNTSWEGEGFEVRGRADHVVMLCHANDQYQNPYHLVVDDLKYGHRLVSPVRNWTLLSHAIGHVIRTGEIPEHVTLRIHQPRAYHPEGPLREWSISYAELLEYHAAIAHRLTNPTDELHTDLDICAKCHALPTCPAARAAGMNAIDARVDVAFDDTMSNDLLAYEMDLLRRAHQTIKNRADALEELITHKVRSGEIVSHDGRRASLKPRLGNRAWLPGIAPDVLCAMTGVDLTKPGVVTPAEAERRGASVDALTQRPNIGTKLEWIDVDSIARRSMSK